MLSQLTVKEKFKLLMYRLSSKPTEQELILEATKLDLTLGDIEKGLEQYEAHPKGKTSK